MKFLHIPFSGGELPSALMAWGAWHRSAPLNAVYSGPTLGRVKRGRHSCRAGRTTAKLRHTWAMPICRKLDGWMLPGKGEAERGLAFGLTVLSLLPSACKGNSKLALMSLARLFPQGRRGKASLHSDSTSLGAIVFAMLLRHFKEWGLGFFFVILFEYIYKMRVNFLVLFCYISFPLFH